MIVRDTPSAWELFFVLRGSIILRIMPQILTVSGLSLLVVVFDRFSLAQAPAVAPLALSVIGAALAIFAAFRNSASYERWWEARKLGGLLVIDSFNLARQAQNYISASDEKTSRRICLRCIALVQVVRDCLRSRPVGEDVASFIPAEEYARIAKSRYPSHRLIDYFSRDIAKCLAEGSLSPQMGRTLEDRVTNLTMAVAAMERTRGTPMPFPYKLLVHRTAYLFCFLLPFGLASLAGWWTPLLAAIISYAFFGLDAIADDLEAPFADAPMVIPLEAMARVVEINVLELLGETELPSPKVPLNYILT